MDQAIEKLAHLNMLLAGLLLLPGAALLLWRRAPKVVAAVEAGFLIVFIIGLTMLALSFLGLGGDATQHYAVVAVTAGICGRLAAQVLELRGTRRGDSQDPS